MRAAFLGLILALAPTTMVAQTPTATAAPPEVPAAMRPFVPTNMKPYFLGLYLRSADAAENPSPEAIQGHLVHLRAEVEAGKMLIVGPALDRGTLGGIAVMAVSTAEEAKQILDDDPMVKTGRMKSEVHPVWLPDLSAVQVIYSKAPAQ
jgi:uncharacterized protein YciI